ncbi:MAG: hypothetical protein EBY17_08310, partial [Acidobacteriia bacterium]|nr:hypothetical protein [Terriglobia bacterium]
MVLSYAAPASSSSGALWVTDSAGRISSVDLNSSPATLYEMSSGFDARGIAGGNSGNFYVASGDFYDSNNRGRQILNCVPGGSLSSSVSCSVIAGTGDYWEGIYGDQFGYWNDEATGQPLTADFINPRGLAFDAANNRLFVADGNAIRVITFVNGAAANVITVAGGATKSTLHTWFEAEALADNGDSTLPVPFDLTKNLYYPNSGNTNGIGESSSFNSVNGMVAVPTTRMLYLADTGNNRIRGLDYGELASSYTLTGPSSGARGVLQVNFKVTPNKYCVCTITITPSGGGLSTPVVLTFSGTSSTFSLTPTATGTMTLTATNALGLTNPSALSYSVYEQPTVTANSEKLSIRATTATIRGAGFDANAANNTVVFNRSAVGTVTSATSTELTVTLSTLPGTTGSLTAVVTVNGNSSGSAVQVATVVSAPTLTLSTVGHSIDGGTITITGTGFHATAASNTVTFNKGAVGTVTAATTTQLSVTFSTQPASVGSLTAAVTAYSQVSDTVQVATIVQPKITSFGFNGNVNAVVVDGNGKAYVGGDFTAWGPLSGPGTMVDTYSGAVETGFPFVNGTVRAVIPDGSGGWYIGGGFSQVDQITRNNLAHILSTGTVDPNWDPNPNGYIYALAISGSTVYAGGAFTTVGSSTTRNRLAAFNATTGTATSFNPNVGGVVSALAISGSTVYA